MERCSWLLWLGGGGPGGGGGGGDSGGGRQVDNGNCGGGCSDGLGDVT